MRELVDVDFPEAERIRVVLDNLSLPPSHRPRRAACSTTPPSTPSWLNMVEIEIGVLKGQCLDRRNESRDRLVAEIDAWQNHRRRQARAPSVKFDPVGRTSISEEFHGCACERFSRFTRKPIVL